ncbi:MAG: CBS domain-containing protein [Bacteroidia bacterium]|nr:CBS domain-containing protein [Bacteroidia bacterium]MCF8425566.1 CBS domain-containing protein [Bacteroidia bacterium]
MNTQFTVSDFMSEDVVVAGLHNKLSEVMKFFVTHKIHHLPVTDKDELVGMVSVTDVVAAFFLELNKGENINISDLDKKYPVNELMTPDPVSVNPDTKLNEALTILREGAFQALPVVENNKVVGIITNKNLISVFAKDVNPPHPTFTIENPGFGI